jgi:hypothetical protein
MQEEKEITRMSMEMLENDVLLDVSEDLPRPVPAISCGTESYNGKEYEIPLATFGNFSFIQAPPKTKKSFFVSLLMSTFLHKEIDGITGDLRGHRRSQGHVIHFDTEQGMWHSSRVMRRPLLMSSNKVENYHTIALRSLSFKDRVDFIEYYLYDKLKGENIDLIAIDGIADLCADVNNIEMANEVVQKLMTWTADLNCHIITVIHSNFGSDKATGHLGSALYKKCETAINLKANTVNHGQVTVECKMSRNSSFEGFDFLVNEKGLPKVQGAVYDILKDYKKPF